MAGGPYACGKPAPRRQCPARRKIRGWATPPGLIWRATSRGLRTFAVRRLLDGLGCEGEQPFRRPIQACPVIWRQLHRPPPVGYGVHRYRLLALCIFISTQPRDPAGRRRCSPARLPGDMVTTFFTAHGAGRMVVIEVGDPRILADASTGTRRVRPPDRKEVDLAGRSRSGSTAANLDHHADGREVVHPRAPRPGGPVQGLAVERKSRFISSRMLVPSPSLALSMRGSDIPGRSGGVEAG